MISDPPRTETTGDDEKVASIDKARERDYSQRARDVVREATSRFEDDEGDDE